MNRRWIECTALFGLIACGDAGSDDGASVDRDERPTTGATSTTTTVSTMIASATSTLSTTGPTTGVTTEATTTAIHPPATRRRASPRPSSSASSPIGGRRAG